MNNGLSLKSNKQKALADFLSCLPQILARAVTPSNVSRGFHENGMISATHNNQTWFAFPCFDGMLSTCQKTLPKRTVDNCTRKFPSLVAAAIEHALETAFDQLGFPLDRNHSGDVVLKEQGISQEWMQWAKCLTHHHQVEQREARVKQALAKKDAVFAKNLQQFTDLTDAHDQCISQLKQIAPPLEVQQLELDHFADRKVTSTMLKGFIHVRSYPTIATPKGFKWPNKGKLDEAKIGKDCLINIAYHGRSNSRTLVKQPTQQQPTPTPPARHLSATVNASGSVLSLCSDEHQKASTLLGDRQWVAKVISTWRLDSEHATSATIHWRCS